MLYCSEQFSDVSVPNWFGKIPSTIHIIPLQVRNEIECFNLSDADILKMAEVMNLELQQGKSSSPDVRKKSSLKMSVTYVRDLCDGTGKLFNLQNTNLD